MTKTRLLFTLAGALCLTGLSSPGHAASGLEEAVRTANAKYLDAPETGLIDDSPKIVAGGGEEGLAPLEEELSLGPLRVTLTYVEDTSSDEASPEFDDIPEEAMLPGEIGLGQPVSRIPVVTVFFSGDQTSAEDQETSDPEARVVATLNGPSSGASNPSVSIQIARLDPSTPYPQVVVSFYTGGAHCCSLTSVVASNADGTAWSVIDVGQFDGGPMLAADLDGNGSYEFGTRDNAFISAFACYACSHTPLKVLALEDGKIVDVSTAPRFKPAHEAWLKNMIVNVADQDVSGFLAGYVGQKIRLGEGREAWDTMLKFHDTGWETETCSVEPDAEHNCPGETIKLTFPDALERMLEKNGYKIEG